MAVRRVVRAGNSVFLPWDGPVRRRTINSPSRGHAHAASAALDTVRVCPAVTFVLDHLRQPPLGQGDFASWARPVRELAAEPRMVCKLSGLVTLGGCEPSLERLRPYVEFAAAGLVLATAAAAIDQALRDIKEPRPALPHRLCRAAPGRDGRLRTGPRPAHPDGRRAPAPYRTRPRHHRRRSCRGRPERRLEPSGRGLAACGGAGR
ncbi:amidohydrolase family protein [Streptomyces sp. NPDC055400]